MKLATLVLGACLSVTLTSVALAATPQPLVPSGPVTNRTPVFKWTDTGADQFTVELTKDESLQTKYVVSSPKMPYPGQLGVGVYYWRVKEGPLTSAFPWSAPLAFTVPPAMPDPFYPVNFRIASASATPDFAWIPNDSDANRFVIQLYKGGNLLDSMTVNTNKSKGGGGLSATWPDSLPAGSYTWRMRSFRKHADPALTLSSPWTEFYPFSIGVPLSCSIIKPDASTAHPIGYYSMSIVWLPASGATRYRGIVLRNGFMYVGYNGTSTNTTFSVTWEPAHYSIIVTPSNSYGQGEASIPVNFTVQRKMTPGSEDSLAANPIKLYWSHSPDCTRYRVRLYRYTPATGVYDLLKEDSIVQSVGDQSWKPGGGLMDVIGSYKWQVTDFKGDTPLYTTADYFSIQVPSRPFAFSPVGKHAAGLANLDFVWSSADGSPTHYQLQVWKDGGLLKDTGWQTIPDFVKTVAYRKTYNLTSYGPGAYQWRVRAKNAAGAGAWRQTETRIAALPTPVIASPSGDETRAVNSILMIQWPRVPDAARYELQFAGSATNISVLVGATMANPQSYGWKVKAGTFVYRLRAGESGWSPWSSSRSITGF
jgi:hypothetical protein